MRPAWPQGQSSIFSKRRKSLKGIIERIVLETYSPGSPIYLGPENFVGVYSATFEERKACLHEFSAEQVKDFIKKLKELNKSKSDIRQLSHINETQDLELLNLDEEKTKNLELLCFWTRINELMREEKKATNHFVFQDAFGKALYKSAMKPQKGWSLKDIPYSYLFLPKSIEETKDWVNCYEIGVKGHEYSYLVLIEFISPDQEKDKTEWFMDNLLVYDTSTFPKGLSKTLPVEVSITRYKNSSDFSDIFMSLKNFNETIVMKGRIDNTSVLDAIEGEDLMNRGLKDIETKWSLDFVIQCLMTINSGDPDIRFMKGVSSKGIDFSGKKRKQKLRKYGGSNFLNYTSVGWSFKKGWVVSGFWRNQAYGPAHSLRRPQYIPSFTKGNKGKEE